MSQIAIERVEHYGAVASMSVADGVGLKTISGIQATNG